MAVTSEGAERLLIEVEVQLRERDDDPLVEQAVPDGLVEFRAELSMLPRVVDPDRDVVEDGGIPELGEENARVLAGVTPGKIGRDPLQGGADLPQVRATGIAEVTPKRRASYDALATTPRPPVPPTIRGRPRSRGSSRASTEA